ncbi:DOPA 4,5-dioxygenase family protein [Cognatishimia sp. SS12]|uniref:DOPA 4,5-dioxygenase family protein n=1 Tax=Cognatishimia sp. SS12 TaxID=2979465 RepID=UPI0023313C81|nr:DOPA 4,5-dioxygenase family protein [Cognatishimia sp. SS12]MDC0738525.1 DOPA 4,5-dioxygenase family protein [Cognatishimia sp. SS12]
MNQIDTIHSYHAHVYFRQDQFEQAETLCRAAVDAFGVEMGRMIPRPIGPHPMPSCQLRATPEQFSKLLPWLALNREGLVVFAHPETGAELENHRDHGIWLGAGLPLDLTIFDRM